MNYWRSIKAKKNLLSIIEIKAELLNSHVILE